MARRRRRNNNQQGFINAYNTGRPAGTPAYGTPEYAAQFDPSQPFGTPQQAGPPPPDWNQIAYETQANRSVQLADATAAYDRGRIQRDFGFNAQGRVDPSNPYSRAALLERSYAQGTRGITNSMAAQGQLYSGATQNAQNANTFNYLTGRNDLRNQYSDALNQTTLGQLGTYASAGGAVSQERINALLRALGQGG